MMEMRFEYWADRWLEFEHGEVKANTLHEYKKIKRYIAEYFSGLKMQEITPQKVQNLLDELYQQGKSKSTISKRKHAIQQIFRYANIQGLQVSNPCSFAKVPRLASKTSRSALSQEEIKLVMLHRSNYECGFYAYFLMMTGFRRSEALALTWEDIDLETDLISVNKAANFIKGQTQIHNALKNGDGVRRIPIPEELKTRLQKFPGIHRGLIFGKNSTAIMNSNENSWRWTKYKRHSGLNITQHMLRHTYCTMLFDAGIDVKTAAYLMGHRDEHTTLATYTHLEKERAARKAIGKLNQFINHGYSAQPDIL